MRDALGGNTGGLVKAPILTIVILFVLFILRTVLGGYVPKRERTGLRIQGPPMWVVSQVSDAATWLRSLPMLESTGAVLYLEGVDDSAVREYLEAHPFPNPTPVGPLTIWPRLNFYHLAATPEQLEALAQVLRRESVKRLAIHASLYRSHDLLLEWYEAFCPPDEQGVFIAAGHVTEVHESPMYLPKEVSEDRVRSFATALSAAYRLEQPKT